MGWFFTAVCLLVLFFQNDISKTDAARITKLDKQRDVTVLDRRAVSAARPPTRRQGYRRRQTSAQNNTGPLGGPVTNVSRWVLEIENTFILGSKGQRSRSQRMCQSTDRMQYYRCCVRKPHWVFPAVMSTTQAMLVTPGFPCITSPRPHAAGFFPVNMSIHQYECTGPCLANILHKGRFWAASLSWSISEILSVI